jgi:hypothetical protein
MNAVMCMKSLGFLAIGRLPGQLVIQTTDRCNARCPQCGMRATERFPRSSLAVDRVKSLIDTAAARGFQAVSFTGGEPLLDLEAVAELARHAGRAGIPYIRTGTNGFLLRDPGAPDYHDRVRRLADTIADTPVRNFWISIDSAVPAVHDAMRGFDGLFEGVVRALPHFHARGVYPSANLGLNRNLAGEATASIAPMPSETSPEYLARFHRGFLEGLRTFYGRVADAGFTMVNTCYPMSVEPAEGALDAVYAATSADRCVRFSTGEKARLFKALLEVVPEFRPKLRVFSPLCSLHALHRHYRAGVNGVYPCRGGIDFLFVDARDGNTYPCGYRGGENLGPFEELDMRSLAADPVCTACDWECFRDPSELLGPAADMFRRPVSVLGKLLGDPDFRSHWLSDLRYYRACDFFDGRRPPNPARLARFRPS